MEWIWILLGVVGLLVLGGILVFNRLVKLRNRVAEAWSGIDVQLRRRHDLVPNLAKVAEAYRVHEASLLTRLTDARAAVHADAGPKKVGEAEAALQQSLIELFAVAENYPDLKASDVYVALQKDMVTVEDELQMARRYYNGTVRNLNTAVQIFPMNLVARAFGFRAATFFQTDDTARAVPKV